MLGLFPAPKASEAGEDAEMALYLLGLIGFCKNKHSRAVIPMCVLVMFTVMLLHIYAA